MHGRFCSAAKPQSGLRQLHRGRAASSFKDLYETDHAETRQGGRFRWLISTCLAATIGAISILVVLYGSSDQRETAGGFLPALTQLDEADLVAFPRSSGLKWSSPKSNRLKIASGSITTRYVVHEQVEQMRAGREYIQVSLLQSRPL